MVENIVLADLPNSTYMCNGDGIICRFSCSAVKCITKWDNKRLAITETTVFVGIVHCALIQENEHLYSTAV